MSFGADHALVKVDGERIEIIRLVINALAGPLAIPAPAQPFSDPQDERDQSSPVVVPVGVFKTSDHRLKYPIVTHGMPRPGPIQVCLPSVAKYP